MPATVINVDEVNSSVERAKKQIKAQQDALDEISNTILFMQGAWQSPAQDAYAESFRNTKRRIEGFNETMQASVDNMQRFTEECVDVDKTTAQELSQISW